MLRTLAAETVEKIGQEVTLFGWVQTRRDHGKVAFIDLRDRSGLVQIVVRELSAEVHDEDVISVLGKVVARSKET
ncbi:MAG: OB-fold nucleic acid binding domain-containing protein, partial [candidate division WWE3 bacterium]|nr:OB-fold nucleic acid binding domain-containing protein [candidate division WWE3 bacterium]